MSSQQTLALTYRLSFASINYVTLRVTHRAIKREDPTFKVVVGIVKFLRGAPPKTIVRRKMSLIVLVSASV